MLLRTTPAIFATLLLFGCSDDGSGGGSGGSGGSAPCGGAGETYSADMSKPGSAGKLVFTLVDSVPAPPQVNDNRWTIAITDAANAPVEGATVTVSPWMPAHQHGTSTQAVITESGGGEYVLDPVNLMMVGLWEVTLSAKPPIGDADSALFAFCIGQ